MPLRRARRAFFPLPQAHELQREELRACPHWGVVRVATHKFMPDDAAASREAVQRGRQSRAVEGH